MILHLYIVMRFKQHWKSKSSSGYAINIGRVSVWKLHWFGGKSKLYICLLGTFIIVNKLLEFIYKRINMIVNVSRMQIHNNYISLRPQMVGDIDMVWLLRGYGEDYGRTLFDYFLDFYLNMYILNGLFFFISFDRFFCKDKSIGIKISSIKCTFMSYIDIMSFYSFYNLASNKYVKLKNFFFLKSNFYIYNYIYYISSFINIYKKIYKILFYRLKNAMPFTNSITKLKSKTINNMGVTKHIVRRCNHYNINFYSYYILNHSYYCLYSNIYIFEYVMHISLFFKKYCSLDNMNFFNFGFDTLVNKKRYDRNAILYSSLYKYNNQFALKHEKNTTFIYLAYGDLFVNNLYRHIDFFLYVYSKFIHYKGISYFNPFSKSYLANINYLRKLYIIIYLYTSRVGFNFNDSIVTLYRESMLFSKYKYRYHGNFLYKIGLLNSTKPNLIGSHYAFEKSILIRDKKIRRNSFEYYQILLWNTYLTMLLLMYRNTRKVYNYLCIIYLFVKQLYRDKLYECVNFSGLRSYRSRLLWAELIHGLIRSNKIFYILYIMDTLLLSSFQHFRNYCFLRFHYYNEILYFIYYLRLVVKRMRTLSRRWPKPEPNTFSKVLAFFIYNNISKDLRVVHNCNISYFYEKINIFRHLNFIFSMNLTYSKLYVYKNFFKDMSNAGYVFNKKFIIDKPSSTFFLYKLYLKLVQWYGKFHGVLNNIIMLIYKIKILLSRYKILFKIILKYSDIYNNISKINLILTKIDIISNILVQCKYIIYIYLLFNNNSYKDLNYFKELFFNFKQIRNLYKSLGFISGEISLRQKNIFLYKKIRSIVGIYFYLLHYYSSGSYKMSILYTHFNSLSSLRDMYCKVWYWIYKLSSISSLSKVSYNYICKSLLRNINFFIRGQILGYQNKINLLSRRVLYYDKKHISHARLDDVSNFNLLYIYRDKRIILYKHTHINNSIKSNIFTSLYSYYLSRWIKSFNINTQDNVMSPFYKAGYSQIIYSIVKVYKYISYIYNFMHSLKIFSYYFSSYFFLGKSYMYSNSYLRMSFMYSDIYLTNIIRVYYTLIYLNILLRNKIKKSICCVSTYNDILYKRFKNKLKNNNAVYMGSTDNLRNFPRNYRFNYYFIRYRYIEKFLSTYITSGRRGTISIKWRWIKRNMLRLYLLDSNLFRQSDKKRVGLYKIYINQILKFDYFLLVFLFSNFFCKIGSLVSISKFFCHINYVDLVSNFSWFSFSGKSRDVLFYFLLKRCLCNYALYNFSLKSNYLHTLRLYKTYYISDLLKHVFRYRALLFSVSMRTFTSKLWKISLIQKQKGKVAKFINHVHFKKVRKSGTFIKHFLKFDIYFLFLINFFRCIYLHGTLTKYTYLLKIFWLYKIKKAVNYISFYYFNRYLSNKMKMFLNFEKILTNNYIYLKNLSYYNYLYFKVRLIFCKKYDYVSTLGLYGDFFLFRLMDKLNINLYMHNEFSSGYGILAICFFFERFVGLIYSVSNHFFIYDYYSLVGLINLSIKYVNLLILKCDINKLKYLYLSILLRFKKLILVDNIYKYIVFKDRDNLYVLYMYCSIVYKFLYGNMYKFIYMHKFLLFYKNFLYKSRTISLMERKYIYNIIFYINYFVYRNLNYNKFINRNMLIYSNSLLKSRLYKIHKVFYRKGDRPITYNTATYKRTLRFSFNYLYSAKLMGVVYFFKDYNIKLLSHLRFWRYYLYKHLVEFRRMRLLGKYNYDYVPKRISYSWYTHYYNNSALEYWYNRMIFDRIYINTIEEFYKSFYIFARSTESLFWEDLVYMVLLRSMHTYISVYILGILGQRFKLQSMNYYPQIYTNEDYLDPPIVDPDFICKYIKIAISKQDTLYEAISEVRVWIIRSIHRFKTFSYFYRKGYRRKIINYKLSYKVPLVRSVKIEISGRVHDRRRTIVRMYKLGWKTTTSRVKDRPLQYSSLQGQSTYGVFGIKVWVFLHYQPVRGLVK